MKRLFSLIMTLLITVTMVVAMLPTAIFALETDTTDTAEESGEISNDALSQSEAQAEPEAAKGAAFYPEDFKVSIPVMKITIKGGQSEIDKMNESDDHSYQCSGTMDIEVPEGFRYADQPAGTEIKSETGLAIEYIRGRGNSTWRVEDNPNISRPYKIKLSKKTDVFGMGKNKHWALLAYKYDPSMMKNRITYWAGRQLGMDYTPEGYPVDVFMGPYDDGSYKYCGSYFLCETIRVDSTRVNIDEITQDSTDITGGYLMSTMQEEGDSVFRTNSDAPLQNVEPNFDPADDGYIDEEQMSYIRGYVQEAEDALYKDRNPWDYFDLKSTAQYWLMQEFTLNSDAYTTGSTYFYKTRDTGDEKGKIYFGPLWDFDQTYGTNDGTSNITSILTDWKWMNAMMKRPDFIEALRAEWPAFREQMEEVIRDGGIIDQYYEEIKVSQSFDWEKQYSGTENDFENKVTEVKKWIRARIDFMDKALAEMDPDELVCKLTIKDGENDTDPEYCYFRKEHFIENYLKRPVKEGLIFKGWFNAEGENLDDLVMVTKDDTYTAQYITKEEATKADTIYFSTKNPRAELIYEEFEPQYTLLPADAQDKEIIWKSSDESIATVDKEGVVHLHNKTGKVTITAVLPTGTEESYELTIYDTLANPESIEVVNPEITLKKGSTAKINVKILPEDASNTDLRYELENDDDTIMVDNAGVIFGLKAGKERVKVTVSYYNEDDELVEYSDYCDVTVEGVGKINTETRSLGIIGEALNLDEVADAVVTEEEKSVLQDGKNILVWLELNLLDSGSVAGADKNILTSYAEMNDLTAGEFVDISLYKQVGDDEKIAVREPAVPVRFTVNIPDSMKSADSGAGRTYYLIGTHEVQPFMAGSGSSETVTCESSQFSTYMLAYSESDEDAAYDDGDKSDKSDSNTAKSSSTKKVKTGDENKPLIWGGLLAAAALALIIFFILRRKNNDDEE